MELDSEKFPHVLKPITDLNRPILQNIKTKTDLTCYKGILAHSILTNYVDKGL